MKSSKSPNLILLASIIPGLGLWILGKRRHSTIAALLVFGSFFVFLFTPSETLVGISCNIAGFLWIMQMFYAGYEARLKHKISIGIAQGAKKHSLPSSPPPNIKGNEKAAFKAKEIVRQQLDTGEHILDAIPVTQMSVLKGAGSYRLYYIGILQDKIILIDTDFLGKPATLQQLDFSSVLNIKVKHGLLSDNLIIIDNSKNSIKLKVTRWLRAHTDNFEAVFLKYKGQQA